MVNRHAVNYKLAGEMAFGVPFDQRADDEQVSKKLLNGQLHLPPHPQWSMPNDINWAANPFGEINWIAQFHMLRWLDPLRRSFERTGEIEFAQKWEKIAISWVRNNPPGRGKVSYAWADMVEAARALTFCFGLSMLQKVSSEFLDDIVESIFQHGEWLAEEKNIRPGNHGLQQHQGLLVIGAVLNREDWIDLAIARCREMLVQSYDEQGVNEEGALQYHQINYSWWNLVKRRIEIVRGESPQEFQRIDSAPLALAHSIRPDGAYELIGDTEVYRPRLPWTEEVLYATTDGASGRPPSDNVLILNSGYIFGRSSWGDDSAKFSEQDFFSLRFGPQNRIHGHIDGMALTLFANGESILVDSGKLAYDHKDPYRAHLTSREGHNSVYLAGGKYDKTHVVQLVKSIMREESASFCFEDNGYGGCNLRRIVHVDFEEKLVLVIDSMTGCESSNAVISWHMGPEFSHRTEFQSVFCRSKLNRVWLSSSSVVRPRVTAGANDPIKGWYSEKWREKIPVRVIEWPLTAGPRSNVTAINYSGAVEHAPVVSIHPGDGPDSFDIFYSHPQKFLRYKFVGLVEVEKQELK